MRVQPHSIGFATRSTCHASLPYDRARPFHLSPVYEAVSVDQSGKIFSWSCCAGTTAQRIERHRIWDWFRFLCWGHVGVVFEIKVRWSSIFRWWIWFIDLWLWKRAHGVFVPTSLVSGKNSVELMTHLFLVVWTPDYENLRALNWPCNLNCSAVGELFRRPNMTKQYATNSDLIQTREERYKSIYT